MNRSLLIASLVVSALAAYSASETHKHTHELGCALDYAPLCDWHRYYSKPRP